MDWFNLDLPAIPVREESIQIINEPSEFYEVLIDETKRAEKRVFWSSLYLGEGQLEKLLVSTLDEALTRNDRLEMTANLSDSYFTNRQDRYILFKNVPELANFFCDVIAEVSKSSFVLQPDGSAIPHRECEVHPFLGDSVEYRRRFQKQIEGCIERLKVSIRSMNQGADTFLYPLLQMGPFNIHQEYDFLKRLFETKTSALEIIMASGYFNCIDEYIERIFGVGEYGMEVLVAAPEANGFFGAAGASKYVPSMYSWIAKDFLKISGRNSKRQIDLREYKRPGWTFHAKGLWMCDEGVAATLIGSSNYGYRSVHRDLEAQVLLVTKNEKLKSRSRDPAVLDACDVVVDVGGVYSHDKKRYDHHQKDFDNSMQSLGILDFSTKLSSAGLIYAHYGRAIIAEVLKIDQDDPRVNIFYRRLYETFVEQIDAVDNGIQQYDGVPRYLSSDSISARVGGLNPNWNEDDVNPNARFTDAMKLVGGTFLEHLHYLNGVWWPARQIVVESVKNREAIDPSGRILTMENGGVPWKEHFFDIEETLGLTGSRMTYMLFGDSTSSGWRVQAIPSDRRANFQNRGPLPKKWRGLRDEELSSVVGVEGCVFVHMTGFIGGHKTREGAIEMARRALPIVDKEMEEEVAEKKAKLGSGDDA
ncbi:unnamed protein product, partial [Mesorhabditis spiculigera]